MATKKYDHQNFSYAGNDGFHVVFNAYTTNTRNGFCHTVQTYWYNGVDYGTPSDTKTPYTNRTWESFEYETTLKRAIEKLPADQHAAVWSVIIEHKSVQDVPAQNRIA